MSKNKPVAMVVWLTLSCVVHIFLFKSKVNTDYQVWQRILLMIIALALVFPIHELLHFCFAKVFCKGKVKIAIVKSPIGLPTVGVIAQGSFQKWQLVIFRLAPFVMLTVVLDVIFVFCAKVELIFFIISVTNCVGSFYDVYETLSIKKKPDGSSFHCQTTAALFYQLLAGQ